MDGERFERHPVFWLRTWITPLRSMVLRLSKERDEIKRLQ